MVVIRVMDKKRREHAAAARLALMDLPCDSSWASLVPAAVFHLVEDAEQRLWTTEGCKQQRPHVSTWSSDKS